MSQEAGAFCTVCQRQTLHKHPNGPSDGATCLVLVLTAGLAMPFLLLWWLKDWLAGQWVCQTCGNAL